MNSSTTWRQAFAVYKHPRVIAMIFLGFAAGLPFLTRWLGKRCWLLKLALRWAYWAWQAVMLKLNYNKFREFKL